MASQTSAAFGWFYICLMIFSCGLNRNKVQTSPGKGEIPPLKSEVAEHKSELSQVKSEVPQNSSLMKPKPADPVPPGGVNVGVDSVTRNPFLWPFSQGSIWNIPIGNGAIYVPAALKIPTGTSVDEDIIIMTPDAPPN